MKLSIIQTGDVPPVLADSFVPYGQMFEAMFTATGHDFSFETIAAHHGAPLPDPSELEAIVITGSSAGVYDDFVWMDPLRDFIRQAYTQNTKMLGICFGHQIMADALGGVVQKSPKGWGLGRHIYQIVEKPDFMSAAPERLAIACSHQDQVITPPATAQIILTSEFTPNAGLIYNNGAALSFQPHPEFDDAFMLALAQLRHGQVPEALIAEALASVDTPSDSAQLASYIAKFLVS